MRFGQMPAAPGYLCCATHAMTLIQQGQNQDKNATPAKIGKCYRAFLGVMAGQSDHDNASNSLQFATWMLAVGSTLAAAGIVAILGFVMSATNKLTKIETQQESITQQIIASNRNNEELEKKQEKQQTQIERIDRQLGGLRQALQITGILRMLP